MKRTIWYLSLIIILIALISLIQPSAKAETEAINWSPPGTLLPGSGNGDAPSIIQAPNGQMMIVYNQWITVNVSNEVTDSDPYYSTSANGGATWTSALPIFNNTLTRAFVSATYDRNSKAHAVWVEIVEGVPNTYRLVYSNNVSGSWSVPKTITSVSSFEAIQHVEIVESKSGILDIVWDGPLATDQSGSSQIKHSRSTNGGQNWSNEVPITSGFSSKIVPTLAADASGDLHVSWQQQAPGAEEDIYYAHLDSAGGATWSSPLLLTSSSGIADEALTPDINVSNTEIQIVFVAKESLEQQVLISATCSLNSACTNIQNWSVGKNISGAFVGVNPGDQIIVVPVLSSDPKNRFLHFHGIPGGSSENKEVIWGTQSCTGWGLAEQDQVTLLNVRSVKPSTLIKDSKIHLVYEQIDSSNNHRIYYINNNINCTNLTRLPVVFKK